MKTALIQEEPVIALFGQDKNLLARIGDDLKPLGLSHWKFSLEKPEQPVPDIYKSLVILTGLETKHDLETMLDKAAALNKHTIVCVPYLPRLIAAFPALQQLWDYWFVRIQEIQNTAIRLLTTAQFIFVDGWIDDGETPTLSSSTILFSELSEGRYWQCRTQVSFVTTRQLTQELGEFLSRPGAMSSVLIQSEGWDCFGVSNQVAGLYEALHHTSCNPMISSAKLETITPFSVQIKTISSAKQNIVGLIVKNLPPPGGKHVLQTPNETEVVVIAKQVPQKTEVVTQPPVETAQPLVLGDQLERIFAQTRVTDKEKHLSKLQSTEKKAKKKLKHNKLLFVVGSVSSGISLAILLLGVLFVFSTNLAKKQIFSISPQQLLFTTSDSHEPTQVEKTLGFLNPQLRLVGQFVDHPMVDEAQSLVGAVKRITTIRTVEQERKKLELTIVGHILGQQQTSVGNVLSDFIRLTQSSYTNMTQLQSIFIPSEENENQNKDWFSNLNNIIIQKKITSGYLQSLSPLLPSLLGLEGKPRVYAVLFLNSSELRPTGGFVQAVALVTIEKGQITATQTFSSYEIDQRIGGVIEPPQEIKEILKEQAWYFRDSNWDPHHPASAERATWFIEKALGVRVDGVLSMPTTAFSKLLESTGPLTLPQYNESLTSKNVQERLNFHAEVELTNQVKNYPSSVLDAFFKHVLQKSSDEFLTVISALPPLMSSGDIQFSLNSASEQEMFQPLRWSGSLVLPVCPSQFAQVPCLVDSVYQVESNVGVNRVNANVSRDIVEKISFSDGRVNHKRTTKLTNASTTTAWPSGQYTTYVRWYLPTKSSVESIVVDGLEVPPSAIRSYQDHGMTVVGTLVEVPIKTSKVIDIKYYQPSTQALPYSYFFFDQRQPGAEVESYQVIVSEPTGSSVVRLAPTALIEDTTLTFEPDKESHHLTAIQFK